MNDHPQHLQSPQTASDRLHPRIHAAAAGLLIWFVVAAWLLFGGAGYLDLALIMISVLVFMAIAIPSALWRANVAAQRSNTSPTATEQASAGLGTRLQG